ncbi:hypothetical protein [Pseudonocardia ailaonensis]|uniref:hypothetical protein n=1 Tax=Pseudonocardia ailaonensis TaxID=367279 RepID=UPI0031DCCCDF
MRDIQGVGVGGEFEGVGTFKGIVRGPVNAEKIAHVPGTPWIITSGEPSRSVPYGRLYAVDTRDNSAQEVYPYRSSTRHDPETFGATPDVLDPLVFAPHGLDVSALEDGSHRLYVVNHGGRQSVEVFDVDLSERSPSLAWRGGVILPRGTWPNDIAALTDGGFLVSSTVDPDVDGVEGGMARMFDGIESVGAVEWHSEGGCAAVPGSTMAGANGILVSEDAERIFIGGWRDGNLVRLTRTHGSTTVDSIKLGILVDNLTWSPDGSILAAGAFGTTPSKIYDAFRAGDTCFFPCKVLRIDAETLEISTVLAFDGSTYGLSTTGLVVGHEIWVSSGRAAGIARFEAE